jgi:hypothetical protein
VPLRYLFLFLEVNLKNGAADGNAAAGRSSSCEP